MLFNVQGSLIAMSYELLAVFKGECMDLEVIQSGNNVSFLLHSNATVATTSLPSPKMVICLMGRQNCSRLE
jgi:hypothetical protein